MGKNKNKLPAGSMFTKVAGVSQLISYKNAQRFDSMIAFNDKIGSDIFMQFINFKDIDDISSLFDRISKLPSTLRFSRRNDGFGYSLQITPK